MLTQSQDHTFYESAESNIVCSPSMGLEEKKVLVPVAAADCCVQARQCELCVVQSEHCGYHCVHLEGLHDLPPSVWTCSGLLTS